MAQNENDIRQNNDDIVLPSITNDEDRDTERTLSTNENDDDTSIVDCSKPSTSGKNISNINIDHTYSLETRQQLTIQKSKIIHKNFNLLLENKNKRDKNWSKIMNATIEQLNDEQLSDYSKKCGKSNASTADEILEEWLDDEMVPIEDDDNVAFAGFEMGVLSAFPAVESPELPAIESPKLPVMKFPTIESVRSMASISENSNDNTDMVSIPKISSALKKTSQIDDIEVPLPKKIKLEEEFDTDKTDCSLADGKMSDDQSNTELFDSSMVSETRIVKQEPGLDCVDFTNQEQQQPPPPQQNQLIKPTVILKPKFPRQTPMIKKPPMKKPTTEFPKPKISLVPSASLMKSLALSSPYPVNLIAVNPNDHLNRNASTSNQSTFEPSPSPPLPQPRPTPTATATTKPQNTTANVQKITLPVKSVSQLQQPIPLQSNIVLSEPVSLAVPNNLPTTASGASSLSQISDEQLQASFPSVDAKSPLVPMPKSLLSNMSRRLISKKDQEILQKDQEIRRKNHEILRLSKIIKQLSEQNIKFSTELDRQIVLTNQTKSQVRELLKVNIILSSQINPDCQCITNEKINQ